MIAIGIAVPFLVLPTLALQESDVDSPEYRPLFDGSSLSGWWACGYEDPLEWQALSEEELDAKREASMADLREDWQIRDGVLVSGGARKYLTTVEEFGDFELIIEYKISEAAMALVGLRGIANIELLDSTKQTGLGRAWGDLNDGPGVYGAYQASGRLASNARWVPGHAPLVAADNAPGQWNRLRVMMVGEQVSVWLNEQLVLDHVRAENKFHRSEPLVHRGPVQIAALQRESQWRGLLVRDLDTEEATAFLKGGEDAFEPLLGDTSMKGWKGSKGAWERVDGGLQAKQGLEGILYTTGSFDDFVLRFQTLQEGDARGGVLLRCRGTGNSAKEKMCEIVLTQETAHDHSNTEPGETHGSLRGLLAARTGYLRSQGEWNFHEVTVREHRVSIDINGTRVLDADLAHLALPESYDGLAIVGGSVGLASYGQPFRIRDVRLRRLQEPWPTLEPFVASRFWVIVPAYSGVEIGGRHTPDTVEATIGIIETFTEVTQLVKGEPTTRLDKGEASGFDPRLRPETSVEDSAWFASVPVIMHALQPLWTDESWDDEDLALARRCAEILSKHPGVHDLEFDESDPVANHRNLARIAEWFTELVKDPAAFALMVICTDEGPWSPRKLGTTGEFSVAEQLPITLDSEIRLLDRKTKDSQFLELVRRGVVSHRIELTELPGNHRLTFERAGDAIDFGPYGWQVQMRFGVPGDVERMYLYLDAELMPLFYYTSW